MNLKNKRALDCPPSSHTQPLLRPSSLAMAGLLATLFPVLATVPTVSYAFGGGDSSYSTPKTLIQKGEDLFRNETFGGNGRTCATCHRPENNFTIDPKFIATLSDKDPLFVAEFNPNLAQNFEDPELMRKYGLILANTNGFGDLQNKFTMRGVPHTLALNTSLTSSDSTTSSGHNLGFSGDGAPGDGSLRAFATGAVTQHFTKTLNRTLGVDFRLPTDEELDAMEAYQRSLGRQQEIILPLSLKSTVARQGQTIFMDNNRGKCMLCHNNAGANTNFGTGNANFNTGVEAQFDRPAFLDRPGLPIDDGRGHPGDGTFNTPPLIEAADTGPFFHDNSVATLEAAVAFYNSDAFSNSPAGQFLGGIHLEATQVEAVASFLRVINVLENIRQSVDYLDRTIADSYQRDFYLSLALAEAQDAIEVLDAGGLHPEARKGLEQAVAYVKSALQSSFSSSKTSYADKARNQLSTTRNLLVNS